MKRILIFSIIAFLFPYVNGAAYFLNALAAKNAKNIAKILFAESWGKTTKQYEAAVKAVPEVANELEALEKARGTGTGGGKITADIEALAKKNKSAALVAVVTGRDATDNYTEMKGDIAGPKVLANIPGANAEALAKKMMEILPKA